MMKCLAMWDVLLGTEDGTYENQGEEEGAIITLTDSSGGDTYPRHLTNALSERPRVPRHWIGKNRDLLPTAVGSLGGGDVKEAGPEDRL